MDASREYAFPSVFFCIHQRTKMNPHLVRCYQPLRPSRIVTIGSLRTRHTVLAPSSFRSHTFLNQSSSSRSFQTSTRSLKNNSNNNHYEQLGLTQSATKKEIKSQFYKLSKLHHPDKNSSEDSRKVFHAINEAYSVLGNDRHRRDYDLTFLDRSGQLYSSSSSSSSSSPPPTRGTLRTTRFRHSAQSARAAAEARAHAGTRATNFGGVGGAAANFKGPVPHFDSKSHQEMHYEQDVRREERRQARERASKEYQWQQQFEETDTMSSKLLRVGFIFLTIFLASSAMRVFADERNVGSSERNIKEEQEEEDDHLDLTSLSTSKITAELGTFSIARSSLLSSSSSRIPSLPFMDDTGSQ